MWLFMDLIAGQDHNDHTPTPLPTPSQALGVSSTMSEISPMSHGTTGTLRHTVRVSSMENNIPTPTPTPTPSPRAIEQSHINVTTAREAEGRNDGNLVAAGAPEGGDDGSSSSDSSESNSPPPAFNAPKTNPRKNVSFDDDQDNDNTSQQIIYLRAP